MTLKDIQKLPVKYKLTNDIYINAVFCADVPGIDSNNIMVMYVDEY